MRAFWGLALAVALIFQLLEIQVPRAVAPTPLRVSPVALSGPRLAPASSAGQPDSIRVLSWNTHGAPVGALARSLGPRQADVLALQEVSAFGWEIAWLARTLEREAVFLPLAYRWRPFGLAVLTGVPVRRAEARLLPSGPEPRAILLVEIPGLAVVNTHLEPSPRRRAQLQVLRQVLEELSGPVVLLGDLNEQGLGDSFPEFTDVGRHSGITYPNLSARIDYILVRGWHGSEADVTVAPDSDHHVVEATIFRTARAEL